MPQKQMIFEYNVIKIPDNPPFSNEDFATH